MAAQISANPIIYPILYKLLSNSSLVEYSLLQGIFTDISLEIICANASPSSRFQNATIIPLAGTQLPAQNHHTSSPMLYFVNIVIVVTYKFISLSTPASLKACWSW